MSATTLRIHPAIGLSRVGNSSEYFLAPETSAGMNQNGSGDGLTGGLPIKPGTESDPISDKDLRDHEGALKRQAQRFRIYSYETDKAGNYPYQGSSEEICIGSTVDGKVVADIIWTVHLANKKANNWFSNDDYGLYNYEHGRGGKKGPPELPPPPPVVRNPYFAKPDEKAKPDLAKQERLKKLVVDAGPRAIQGTSTERVNFDRSSTPSYGAFGSIQNAPDYPVSFPEDHFQNLYSPSDIPVRQLGALETDKQGRLIVIGGEGTATAWAKAENDDGGQAAKDPKYNDVNNTGGIPQEYFPLNDDVNNDGWFDDTADGPVQAVLVFEDGSTLELESSAWAVSTDPGYAPQVRNVVTIWDEVYDTWLHHFDLDASLYSGASDAPDDSGYNKEFEPSFSEDIFPMFRAAHLQQFTTGLNQKAIGSHGRLDAVTADMDPTKLLHVKTFIRSPYLDDDEFDEGSPRMPLALGDASPTGGSSFLTLTKTQYFFLNQWFEKNYNKNGAPPLAPGELLDKNVLTNLLGGRFSPGIDLTYIVRDTAIYDPKWTEPSVGPFRFNRRPLDYSKATKNQPFLGVGYRPQGWDPKDPYKDNGVEPGDICKFMALPWHADYNSCATHLPAPNPGGEGKLTTSNVFDGRNTTLFWSWPAQRPVSVYVYEDVKANGGKLTEPQRYSVRGEGTRGKVGEDGSVFAAQQSGRFQVRADMVRQWQDIGTVIQGPAIDGYPAGFDGGLYLEVASNMSYVADRVQPWPIVVTDKTVPAEPPK